MNDVKLARWVPLSGNIGDFAQVIGLEEVYKKLRITPNFDAFSFHNPHWTGEEQIMLPFACLVSHNEQNVTPLECSDWLHPVFLGVGFSDMLSLDTMQNLLARTHGLPILCRDATSADLVTKAGFNGKFWGCASLLLPRREQEPANGKIYTCDLDITPNIIEYIPDSIKKEMIALESQELPVEYVKSLSAKELTIVEYEKMKEKIALLRNTAKLVITTRLHIALPCIAMGIPVIKISSQREQRTQLVDVHARAYRASEFGEIDWNPPVPDIEEAKSRMLGIACDVLRAACDRVAENQRMGEEIAELQAKCFKKPTRHYFTASYRGYAGLPPAPYSLGDLKTQPFFKRLTGKNPEDVDLVFYGAGINGMHLLQNLKNLVDACKSFTFVDSSPGRQGKTYGGYSVKSPECLHDYDKNSLVVFVTPFGCCGGAAEAIAEYLENTFDLRENVHFYLYEILTYSTIQECFGLPCVTSAQFRNDKSLGAWEFV